MWCIREINDEFKEKMLDVLEVYERPYDSKQPVVCVDEKSKQLLIDSHPSIPMKPGHLQKTDYEYKRHGTANIFVAIEPKGKRRKVIVTKHRKALDFAKFTERLVNTTYKKATKVILVTDNLNIHSAKSIITSLGETRGQQVLSRIEWHYTPKHASWLDQAEIEINVLSRQCLSKRTGTFYEMQHRCAVWQDIRNADRIGINWQFSREKATEKFKLTKEMPSTIKEMLH
jgi:hypothetical protein